MESQLSLERSDVTLSNTVTSGSGVARMLQVTLQLSDTPGSLSRIQWGKLGAHVSWREW
jgi:hypothetical protein